MNYEYKNPEVESDNKQLLIGYLISLSGALGTTILLRQMAKGFISAATGN